MQLIKLVSVRIIKIKTEPTTMMYQYRRGRLHIATQTSTDKEHGIFTLNNAIEACSAEIEIHKGKVVVKEPPRAADEMRKSRHSRRIEVPIHETVYSGMTKAQVLEAHDKELRFLDKAMSSAVVTSDDWEVCSITRGISKGVLAFSSNLGYLFDLWHCICTILNLLHQARRDYG
ncbi:hypothetical protein IFM89_019220 [Coptis chinensis]|uniref:Uncharacterized protein n=1 Tax=Coptis chinensis TaxID=261450 RepID=A0A835IX58_9MAGN|nr:hypothetical protein IFM89_019220 [Coptis chinensis]